MRHKRVSPSLATADIAVKSAGFRRISADRCRFDPKSDSAILPSWSACPSACGLCRKGRAVIEQACPQSPRLD